MWLARVPRGQLGAPPEYRTATGWSTDSRAAPCPILQRYWAENPMQPRFIDGQWVSATKVDGYWGDELSIDVARDPWGPWTTVARGGVSPRGGDPTMNTYQAHVLPWRDRLRSVDRDALAERPQHGARRLPAPGALPAEGDAGAVDRGAAAATTTTADVAHDDHDPAGAGTTATTRPAPPRTTPDDSSHLHRRRSTPPTITTRPRRSATTPPTTPPASASGDDASDQSAP